LAREGATVHLAGRTRGRLDPVDTDIERLGGHAAVAERDVLDEAAVNAHADAVAAASGRIDIAVHAVGIVHL
jgi:NAD(P)-dependent dehydrogenase (short-subunit alcohol dehydrogenase family)